MFYKEKRCSSEIDYCKRDFGDCECLFSIELLTLCFHRVDDSGINSIYLRAPFFLWLLFFILVPFSQ